jgi:hypothetical protein
MPTRIQQGSAGAVVQQWQRFLNTQGANLNEDGDFGPITANATRNFQTQHGLGNDGVVGRLTWNKAREVAGYGYTNGRELRLNGESFRFVGVNLRGLIHYGDPTFVRTTESRDGDRQNQLNQARNIGARVVRVVIAGRNLSKEEVDNRLQRALNEANPPGQSPLLFVVAFTDVHFNDTFLTINGDDQFYDGMLKERFYEQDFRVNYLPFVEHIVTRFREDRRILAWELGNELKARPDIFVNFAEAVSNRIFELDAFHLITTGIINLGSLSFDYDNLPARNPYTLPNIDFGTIHFYKSNDNGHCFQNAAPEEADFVQAELDRVPREIAAARAANRPVIIEEFGCCSGDRAETTRDFMTRHFNDGVAGFLQWGFMAAGGSPDTGDGDHRWGMDRELHGDYDALAAAYQQQAVAL